MAKTTSKASPATKTKRAPVDIKKQLEATKRKLASLEEKLYASTIDEMIVKQNIVSSFKVIKANVADASDITILAAIGRAVGIKRLKITQEESKPRAKKPEVDASK
jgi:hypothetical protein